MKEKTDLKNLGRWYYGSLEDTPILVHLYMYFELGSRHPGKFRYFPPSQKIEDLALQNFKVKKT